MDKMRSRYFEMSYVGNASGNIGTARVVGFIYFGKEIVGGSTGRSDYEAGCCR